MFSLVILLLTLIALSWLFWRKYSPYFSLPICSWNDWKLIYLSFRKKELLKEVKKSLFSGKKYGKEGMFFIWFMKPVLVVYGPESYKFFATETNLADKPNWIYRFFSHLEKNAIFRSNGDSRKKQRKLFRQAFYPSMLIENISAMNVHAAHLVQTLSQLKNNTTEDIEEVIKHNILLLIYDAFLDMKPDSPEKECLMKKILDLGVEHFDLVIHRAFRPWLYARFMMNFFADGRYILKIEKDLVDTGRQIAEYLKKSYSLRVQSKNSDNTSEPNTKYFGDILIETYLKDPSFTFEVLRTEINTLIVAGVDTTSACLTWTLWLLGHHLKVQEKALDEIKSLADDVIRYEDLSKLTYLECVVKESLRCYPVGPLFVREATKDLHFGKYTIPNGTTVVFVPYMLHKDPDLYPHPETFDPERFAENQSNTLPSTYMPFAEGVRSCVGKTYAMIELKVYLAYILRNFEVISVGRTEDVEDMWGTTLKSTHPISLKFIPRKHD